MDRFDSKLGSSSVFWSQCNLVTWRLCLASWYNCFQHVSFIYIKFHFSQRLEHDELLKSVRSPIKVYHSGRVVYSFPAIYSVMCHISEFSSLQFYLSFRRWPFPLWRSTLWATSSVMGISWGQTAPSGFSQTRVGALLQQWGVGAAGW